MKLGQLISQLESVTQDKPVVFDKPQPFTTGVGSFTSYRGYYNNLALTPAEGTQTVAELLEKARAAQGATFQGYKGGDYVMDADTPVWVAEYGVDSGTGIIGVVEKEHFVEISTLDVSDYQGF